jgi:hypothetical protein
MADKRQLTVFAQLFNPPAHLTRPLRIRAIGYGTSYNCSVKA